MALGYAHQVVTIYDIYDVLMLSDVVENFTKQMNVFMKQVILLLMVP